MIDKKKFSIALGFSIVSFALTLVAVANFGFGVEQNPFFKLAFQAGLFASVVYFILRWLILFGLVELIEKVQPTITWHYTAIIAIFGLDMLNNVIHWGLYIKTYI